jgi:hypothetical protein
MGVRDARHVHGACNRHEVANEITCKRPERSASKCRRLCRHRPAQPSRRAQTAVARAWNTR